MRTIRAELNELKTENIQLKNFATQIKKCHLCNVPAGNIIVGYSRCIVDVQVLYVSPMIDQTFAKKSKLFT